ncbi:MAG: signal recognition particle subunit SRP19/SEC65 family protein [Candidatus Caldarchaeum sp.]
MIRRDGLILWPVYFDSKSSRKQGRRVSRGLAVQRPSADDLAAACRRLGYEVEKAEAAYPRRWSRRTGYVVVKPRPKMSKNMFLKMVAEEMRKHGK